MTGYPFKLQDQDRMDSFETTKIIGAVLCAVLVIVGANTVVDLTKGGHGDGHDIVGYELEVDGDAAGGAQTVAASAQDKPVASDATKPEASTAPAQPAASDAKTQSDGASDTAKVAEMVASASAEAGARLFKKCKGCHTAGQGGKAKVGPNLFGIVGRNKAGKEGFSYSKAMASKGGAWTVEDLFQFLRKPKGFVPGTKMIFRGVKKDKDIACLLAYLLSLK